MKSILGTKNGLNLLKKFIASKYKSWDVYNNHKNEIFIAIKNIFNSKTNIQIEISMPFLKNEDYLY
jgi:hypothetical protein